MFYTYEYTQYLFSSAHSIIYTALSTLYLRALHPDCMFGIKQLYNKVMDVALVCYLASCFGVCLLFNNLFCRDGRRWFEKTGRGDSRRLY